MTQCALRGYRRAHDGFGVLSGAEIRDANALQASWEGTPFRFGHVCIRHVIRNRPQFDEERATVRVDDGCGGWVCADVGDLPVEPWGHQDQWSAEPVTRSRDQSLAGRRERLRIVGRSEAQRLGASPVMTLISRRWGFVADDARYEVSGSR